MREDMFDAYMKDRALPLDAGESYDQKIRETLDNLPARKPYRGGKLPGRRLALAAVLAIALVLFVEPGSDVMLTTQYLRGYSTEDGKQYIIEGIYKEAGIARKADADADGWVHIQDHAELMTFLGMGLQIPQRIGEDWTLSDIVGRYMDYGLYLGLDYVRQGGEEELLSFVVQSEPYMEERIQEHAQAVAEGTRREIDMGGTKAYLERDPWSQRYRILWEEEACSFQLEGPSAQELEPIAAEMMQMYRAWPQAARDRWIPTGEESGAVDSRMFTTYEEIDAFFEGKAPIPAEQYEEWRIADYAGNKWMVDSWQYDVHAWYHHPHRPGKQLMVSTFTYQKFENVNMTFEQNSQGEVIRHKGLNIYVTRNIDKLVCICLKERTLYFVSGHIELDTAKSILDQLVP